MLLFYCRYEKKCHVYVFVLLGTDHACISTTQGNLVLGQTYTKEAARHIAEVRWPAQRHLTATYQCVLPQIAAIYALEQPNSR